jgi:hypothetical protein
MGRPLLSGDDFWRCVRSSQKILGSMCVTLRSCDMKSTPARAERMTELTLRVPPSWLDALDNSGGSRQRSELIRQCIAIGAQTKGLVLTAN